MRWRRDDDCRSALTQALAQKLADDAGEKGLVIVELDGVVMDGGADVSARGSCEVARTEGRACFAHWCVRRFHDDLRFGRSFLAEASTKPEPGPARAK